MKIPQTQNKSGIQCCIVDWGIIKREEYGTCRFPKLREPQKQVDQNFANARIHKQEVAEAPHMDWCDDNLLTQ